MNSKMPENDRYHTTGKVWLTSLLSSELDLKVSSMGKYSHKSITQWLFKCLQN